jgi:hypothetical protein
MKLLGSILLMLVSLVLVGGCAVRPRGDAAVVSGELKQWHDVVLTFDGPMASERGPTNPFLDCRLTVAFAQDEKVYVVPGYFAADGDAGQTGAKAGNKWRAHFLPPEPGLWTYTASFRYGADVALDPNATAGTPGYFDRATGSFLIEATDKVGRDFRAQGLLQYVGQRYLQFAGTKTHFIKGGADSPENFLAYADFDDTYDTEGLTREGEATGDKFIHTYDPHVEDWRPGDPTWRDGKGKGIIGALNYLASKGMNSVYFLTYNLDGGDGKDVWMWTDPVERYRFDCSKLDQWEIVFSHMDKLGLMLHVVTQEQENDQGLDKGGLGIQRKLYYRELIARFGHHPAVVWNLGEENTNTTEQRKAFARYIHELDPYDHPVVCHTFPGQYNQVYEPLLGYEWFEGPSLQTNDTHAQTLKWVTLSAQAGRPWVVCLDEIGPHHTGVKPDKDDFWHDEARIRHLWGNLMAGGAGVEWYFGYNYTHNDLNCESWHSRDHLWDMTRYALEFFHGWLPFASMTPRDELTTAQDDHCLADPGNVYAVYLPAGGAPELDLGDSSATFEIQWFNPRRGGSLQIGTILSVAGPGKTLIGQPREDTDKDWVALVERAKPRRPSSVTSLPESVSP